MSLPNAKDGQRYHDIITVLRKEAFKEYRVYDGLNRETDRYQAPANAKTGDDCLHTRRFFDGSSNRISYVKEEVAEWDASWEQA